VTRKRFVNGVIDDFVRQVIRPRSIGVHARTAPDRFESTEDFNVRSVVSCSHRLECKM
jgi:hypothetical protein